MSTTVRSKQKQQTDKDVLSHRHRRCQHKESLVREKVRQIRDMVTDEGNA